MNDTWLLVISNVLIVINLLYVVWITDVLHNMVQGLYEKIREDEDANSE